MPRAAVLLPEPLSPRKSTLKSPIDGAQHQSQFQFRRSDDGGKRVVDPIHTVVRLRSPCASSTVSAFNDNLAKSLESFGIRLLPQLAIRGFEQPFGDRIQRPGIRLSAGSSRISGDEGVVFGQPLVDEIGRDLSRRIEAENVVDRRRQFQPALVAVALHARRATSD